MEGIMNGRNLIHLRLVSAAAITPGLLLLAGCGGKTAHTNDSFENQNTAMADSHAEERLANSPRGKLEPAYPGFGGSLDQEMQNTAATHESYAVSGNHLKAYAAFVTKSITAIRFPLMAKVRFLGSQSGGVTNHPGLLAASHQKRVEAILFPGQPGRRSDLHPARSLFSLFSLFYRGISS